MAQGDPIPTIGSVSAKVDQVLSAIDHQNEKLWGKDGFTGDIVDIKASQAKMAECVEALQQKANDNAANIKVLQEAKLGWKDWKFIVLIVLATAGAGGAGAGVSELLK